MRPGRLVLLLSLAAPSCAVGVDSGNDLTGPETGAVTDAAGGDAGSGPADTGTPFDTGTSDTGSTGEGGLADTGTVADTGGGKDAVADTAPPDTGTTGCVGHGTSGVLVTFNLSGQTGGEATALPASSAAGIASGAISRSSALTAVSGSGSINSSGWPTTATADATHYYTFTVTPAAGCTVTLTSLALDLLASSTGPSKGDVATSADSFAAHTTSFATTTMPTAILSGASGSGPLEVRVYGYGASGSGGTFRIQQTLTLSGSIN